MSSSKVDLNKYGLEILKENVGEGGSAVVHQAKVISDSGIGLPELGSHVAVKQYHESIMGIPNQLDRIKQEGTIGTEINSSNVVQVYGHVLPKNEEKNCFLFMEWLDGETLDVYGQGVRQNVAWGKLKEICLHIIDGVETLHSQGIMHRDIKPENVMVVSNVAKIMDIGIAEKTADNDHTLHTLVKDFIGSVRYASRQFVLGQEFDYSDDIYSIGATFLEFLTGTPPYNEIERKPVLPIAVVNAPPAVNSLRDNVPAAIKILIEGCVHPDRQRRPSLAEIRESLNDEGKSPYIKKEIQRQATDQRAYKIIQIDSTGGGFFADIGSEQPELMRDYTVVRKEASVTVPSLNAEVESEMWIATAELRHIHQSIGHFKLTHKKWIPEERPRRASDLFYTDRFGHWEEKDVSSIEVAVGDYVLKNKE